MLFVMRLWDRWRERFSFIEIKLLLGGIFQRMRLFVETLMQPGALVISIVVISTVSLLIDLSAALAVLVMAWGRSTVGPKDLRYCMTTRVLRSMGVWLFVYKGASLLHEALSHVWSSHIWDTTGILHGLFIGYMVLSGCYMLDASNPYLVTFAHAAYRSLSAWMRYFPMFFLLMICFKGIVFLLVKLLSVLVVAGIAKIRLLSSSVLGGHSDAFTVLTAAVSDLFYAVAIVVYYESIRFYEEYIW